MSIVHVAFYPSDWLAGTRGLTDAETGVYITLICRMYEMAAPIERDDDRLSRLCGCKSKASFVKSLNHLLSEGKIIEVDRTLFNERVQKEIKNTTEKSSKAKSAAQSRWDRKPNKNNDRPHADASPKHMPQPCQSEPESEPITTLLSASADLDQEKIDLMVQALGITDETKSVGLLSWSEPLNWISNGCSFDHDIIPTLKAIASRDKAVNSWSYCSKAIFDAKAKREAPAPDPSTNVTAFAGYKQSETAIERVMRQAQEARDAAS